MSNLSKIIKLIKKTGGRYIVSDEEGECCCVILTVDDYERILAKNRGDYEDNFKNYPKSLTDREILAKINADIALWKESQKQRELDELADDFTHNSGELAAPFLNNDDLDEEDRYYLEPIE